MRRYGINPRAWERKSDKESVQVSKVDEVDGEQTTVWYFFAATSVTREADKSMSIHTFGETFDWVADP